MIVKNPSKLPTIDYRIVKPLQGQLKDLSKENYQKLKNVLDKRGFTTPLFLWKSGDTHYLMDGHQRQRVMQKEDMKPYEVPYVLIDAADEKEAKEQLLEITSQYGTITQEGFDEFTADLPEAELVDVNFDALPLLGSDEPDVEEDETPEVDDTNVESKLGEIYQLGNHRVMCGDSTDDAVMATLLDGAAADMVFTDPPWNVDYVPESQPLHRKKNPLGGIQGDKMNDEDWLGFLESFATTLAEAVKPGGAVYIAMGQSEMPKMCLLLEANFHRSDIVIWKKHWQFGRSDYHRAFEPIFYGWRKGGSHYFIDDRTQTDVWEISKGDTMAYTHPTQKPIELVARAVANSSKEGEVVLDMFGGSGSTLLACDQLGRTCRMMELDPKYVDVIRKRYAKSIDKEDDWINATPVISDRADNGKPKPTTREPQAV